MMTLYKSLLTMTLLAASLNAIEQTTEMKSDADNTTKSTLDKSITLWEGHDQYLFFQFSLVPRDQDDLEFGTDVEEKEKEVGLVYYLQLAGPFYAKGGLGKATYSYTESYISSGALVERRDVKFSYLQGGAALALYKDRFGIITVDMEYMKPYSTSATKEQYGVVTPIKNPDARVMVSCNGNFCVNNACIGAGVSNTRYSHDLIFSLRMGVRF